MKEHPILFSAPMVRALLDGSKTQTRRVVKQNLKRLGDGDWHAFDHKGINYRVNARHTTTGSWRNLLQFCPYGQIGDQLWVRETFAYGAAVGAEAGYGLDDETYIEQMADDKDKKRAVPREFAIANKVGVDEVVWTPSIHMPRWASRIQLEITGVRVERLQDISEEDAKAEGVERRIIGEGWREYGLDAQTESYGTPPLVSAQESFHSLWQSINGPGSWEANPWVWVIEFRRVA